MSDWLDGSDDETDFPTISKGDKRSVNAKKAVKFEITDNDGDTWQEYITHDEVHAYRRQGYKLSRVYFWQVWR